MPLFTLHRNFILRTTKGHTLGFKKGVPTHVPPICIEDAVGIGAIPANAEDGDILGVEAAPQPSLNPVERKEKVFAAFGIMKTRNERGDFTASGVPNAKRLPALLGFELTSRERDTYWLEFRAKEQDSLDQFNLDVRMADTAEVG